MSGLQRYSLWQLSDFLRDKGVPIIIVGVLVGVTTIAPLMAMMGPAIVAGSAAPTQILIAVLAQLGFIAVLIALNGIVSHDRKMGYYKFLFAKPVSVTGYYAQAFVVNLIGYLVAGAVLYVIFALIVAPVKPWGTMGYLAFVYLAAGGIAFFVSTVSRHDWIGIVALWGSSTVLRSIWSGDGGWREAVLYVLPPVHKLGGALGAFVDGGEFVWSDIAWVLGYSALFFVAGILVLRKRPFS